MARSCVQLLAPEIGWSLPNLACVQTRRTWMRPAYSIIGAAVLNAIVLAGISVGTSVRIATM